MEIDELIKKLPTMSLEEMLQEFHKNDNKGQTKDLPKKAPPRVQRDREEEIAMELDALKTGAYITDVVTKKMENALKHINGEDETNP